MSEDVQEPTTVEDAWTEVYAWMLPGPDRDGMVADVRVLVERVRAEERAAAQELADALTFALEHVEELEDAWARGTFDERDSLGGTRSNRNVSVRVRAREALEAWKGRKRDVLHP